MSIIKTYYLNDWNQIQLPRWSTIVNGNSVILMSPYHLHRCNLCWDICPNMLTYIITLYQNKPFYLYNTHHINSSHLLFEGKILEMVLKIQNLKQTEQKSNTTIVNTKNIFLWSKIFTNATVLKYKMYFLFIKEFAKLSHIYFFILYLNNIPIATSMLNIYHQNAVISSIAVLNEFRAQGFGKVIILKTIDHAYKLGIKNIYIYSMEQICNLYKNLGFNIIEKRYLYKNKAMSITM